MILRFRSSKCIQKIDLISLYIKFHGAREEGRLRFVRRINKMSETNLVSKFS